MRLFEVQKGLTVLAVLSIAVAVSAGKERAQSFLVREQYLKRGAAGILLANNYRIRHYTRIKESKSKDLQNPWRTGGWVVIKDEVIKDEAIKRMGIQPPELEEQILKRRMAFLPDDAWDLLGLPRGESDGEVTSTEASR